MNSRVFPFGVGPSGLTTMSSGRNSPPGWFAKPHRRSSPVPWKMKTRFAPFAGSYFSGTQYS